MTPEQLAGSGTEHAEQMAVFCWANIAMNYGFAAANAYSSTHMLPITGDPVPFLRWLHAIPNAGARGNKVAAAQLKAEGVKAGVSDIFLPVKSGGFSGLYIEMKRANGRLSDVTPVQRDFMMFVESQGFVWTVAFGWKKAVYEIERYLLQMRVLPYNTVMDIDNFLNGNLPRS